MMRWIKPNKKATSVERPFPFFGSITGNSNNAINANDVDATTAMRTQQPLSVHSPSMVDYDVMTERVDSDDDDAVVIDQRPVQLPAKYKRSTYDADDEPSKCDDVIVDTNAREDGDAAPYLNSLFNGHLMKWKHDAEEGTPFIRIPAFFAALGLIGTTIATLVTDPDSWVPHSLVISSCVIFIAMFILVLDSRFLATSPLSIRAHLRNVITKNFNVFRFLWGRGLLYVVAGALSCAEIRFMMLIAGSLMLGIGLLAILVGTYSFRKFTALRNALADESHLLLMFSGYDYEGIGYLGATEFSHLLIDAGLDLDDRYTLKAFNAIDTNRDRKISFREFYNWWSDGFIERGRRVAAANSSEDEDGDENHQTRKYYRMT
jgi:hypothetical protein